MATGRARPGTPHQQSTDHLDTETDTEQSTAEWLETAKQLAERLTHHRDEEEVEIFPVAGKVLSEQEKEQLAVEYADDMERRREKIRSRSTSGRRSAPTERTAPVSTGPQPAEPREGTSEYGSSPKNRFDRNPRRCQLAKQG